MRNSVKQALEDFKDAKAWAAKEWPTYYESFHTEVALKAVETAATQDLAEAIDAFKREYSWNTRGR